MSWQVLLLPIWKQLPQDETRVYRLQTDDGQRIIGRRVSPAWVATTLAEDAPKLTAAQVHALVLEGKTVVRLAEGMELHRSRVMGVNRIELSGFHGSGQGPSQGRWLLLGNHRLEAAALLPDGSARDCGAGAVACAPARRWPTCTQ